MVAWLFTYQDINSYRHSLVDPIFTARKGGEGDN